MEPSPPALHALWHTADRHRWEAFHAERLGGLQQSWAYGDALQALGVPVLRVAVTSDAAPHAPWLCTAQFLVQRLPWFVRFAYTLGGPLPVSELLEQPAQLQRALALIRQTFPLPRPRIALMAPALALQVPEQRQALSAWNGRWKVMSGHSTVLLSLEGSAQEVRARLEGRWRNRLVAAERGPVKVRECGSKASDYRWLVEAEAEQRRSRRYFALPPGFVSAFQSHSRKPSQALLTLAGEIQHQRCAGMLFLVHGTTATYHLGWTNEEGRRHGAHPLLLWQACLRLAERGVRRIDLGGVDTTENPGLARFKLGTGGAVATWAGTFA